MKKDKFDDQAILGAVECAKKLSAKESLLKQVEKICRGGTNGDSYSLNMSRVLLAWDLTVEYKGSDYVRRWISVARGANSKGFLVNFRMALLPNDPKVKRKKLDELYQKYSHVQGLQFYRILSYIEGDLGGGYVDPDTGKIVNDTDRENFRKPGRAIELLTPYLAKKKPPVWAAHLAAMAYFLKKDMTKANHWRDQVRTAASGGHWVYKRWNGVLEKLWGMPE